MAWRSRKQKTPSGPSGRCFFAHMAGFPRRSGRQALSFRQFPLLRSPFLQATTPPKRRAPQQEQSSGAADHLGLGASARTETRSSKGESGWRSGLRAVQAAPWPSQSLNPGSQITHGPSDSRGNAEYGERAEYKVSTGGKKDFNSVFSRQCRYMNIGDSAGWTATYEGRERACTMKDERRMARMKNGPVHRYGYEDGMKQVEAQLPQRSPLNFT